MLRDLTAHDEQALAAFFAANNVPEITASFHPFPLDAASAHRICAKTRKDRYFVFAEDDTIIGFAMLRGWDEGFDIPSFGILVDYRAHGRGIGKSLTDYAIRMAKQMSASCVRLTVHPKNQQAVRLYESTGFRAAETLADGRVVMFADLDVK